MNRIDYDVMRRVFRIQIQQAPETTLPLAQAIESKPETPDVLETTSISPPSPTISADKSTTKGSTADFAAMLAGVSASPQQKLVQQVQRQASGVRERIGRNDPCWCGSGKKWKKCHFPDKGK